MERLTAVVFKVLGFIMKLAPLGAFGAMAYAIGEFGLSTLTSLGSLIALFYVTSILFVVVVLGSVMLYMGLNIFHLLRYLQGGAAADPRHLDRRTRPARPDAQAGAPGVESPPSDWSCPPDTRFNLDGAAIYLSLAALYIAQATNTT